MHVMAGLALRRRTEGADRHCTPCPLHCDKAHADDGLEPAKLAQGMNRLHTESAEPTHGYIACNAPSSATHRDLQRDALREHVQRRPAHEHFEITSCPAPGAVSATSSLSGDGHSRSITPELATEDDPDVTASPNVRLFPMFRPKSQRKVQAAGAPIWLLNRLACACDRHPGRRMLISA